MACPGRYARESVERVSVAGDPRRSGGRSGGVSGLLPAQAPDDLVRTALLVCGDCDMTSQFHVGVDLMIRGLDAYLQTLQEDTVTAPA